MNVAFADSYFFLALMNPRDGGHVAAKDAAKAFTGRILTTQWVLLEVADAFCAARDREKFMRLLDGLETNPQVSIVPAEAALFNRGVALYRGRPDKDWSLTDCLSFIVMQDNNVHEAFTEDVHFEQAGYAALLRSV